MSAAKMLKWGLFGYEAFLAIPLIGGTFIVANGWIPLWIAFFLHVAGFFFSKQAKMSAVGNGFGIVTSIIGFIPFVGWFFHAITAITLLVEGLSAENKQYK
ncbi:hypothetical protein NDS46_31560 (plasmid) [Paenibacillus thiaminolyticus]|uniref:hypothetical protein n=1 Tax=Paenibacillus thiaminolyticus TaxID=49283 RepID=UPI00232DD0DB|nr:hypothetical protein [Paenibacillus thiaminolyticus]WCF11496.1 hypothetical protein NDS46_31560 [Paenibacillus thiaminolyticus]